MTDDVALRGQLAPQDGGGEDPRLRLVDGELVLEAAHRQVAALVGEPRYQFGRLWDQADLRGVSLTVPARETDAVRGLIARARLGAEALPALVGLFLEEASAVERVFLASWLHPGERLLGYLATETERPITSTLGPEVEVPLRLVWTDRRAELVALHPLGDVATWAIDETPRATGGRWRAGVLRWKMPKKSALKALAPHLLASRAERLRFVVDASRPPSTPAERAAVMALLADLAHESPVAELERQLLVGEEPSGASVSAAEGLGDALPAHLEPWGLPAAATATLEAALRASDDASAAALALHRARRARGEAPALEARVAADVAFAEHLVVAGDHDEARAVLDERLATLAPLELDDLLPPGTGRRMAQDRAARAALLEARVRLGLGVGEALGELARQRPLQVEAAERYAAEAGRGAARVVTLLDRGALATDTLDPAGRTTPLAPDEVELLRHPVGRGSAFLGMIQSLVASVQPPDTRLLRQYASTLRADDHPRAAAAYGTASAVLGQRAEVFVSLGKRSVGARAYEVGEGLIVLGGEHLDARSPLHLGTDAELRFAFGSELAHLRLGHRLATEDEVWAGLRTKGLTAAELVLGVVPLLGRFPIGRRLGQIAGAVDAGKIDRAIELGKRFVGDDAPIPGEAHVTEGRMLAAHRLMQLGADRAGLVLAGDPVPAVRAMLRLDGNASAPAFTQGAELVPWLLERDGEDTLVREALAIRVGALVSFWLSDEYAALAR